VQLAIVAAKATAAPQEPTTRRRRLRSSLHVRRPADPPDRDAARPIEIPSFGLGIFRIGRSLSPRSRCCTAPTGA